MSNDATSDGNETTGPVAGEALKNAARWPGYVVIVIGLVATALSLAGFAVGRASLASVGVVIAVLALGSGVLWQFFQHRRLSSRLGTGTPERPEDAAPLT